jgi:hypothetical protein
MYLKYFFRYSIWLDSKLRLQLDPLLILEYFLWRKGYEYAISNHYDRHCVWEEVVQNKKLNKYNHTIIDEQFAFYRADGLQRFNASDPNKLLPSSMCFIRIYYCPNLQLYVLPPTIYDIICLLLCWLQMYLKDLLSLGLTLRCQICSPAFGSMKLSGSLLVIN